MPRSSGKNEETFLQFVIDVLVNSVVIILVFFLMKAFVVAPFKVDGSSMVDTLHHKEYILVSKIEYLIGDPQRGDIIVFHPPVNEDQYYIKRIIGLPGDTVRVSNNTYIINGQPLDESEYIDPDVSLYGGSFLQENQDIIIPDGTYFVSGDNRPHSSDSRELGPVDKVDFIGKVFLRYWPFSDAGLIIRPEYK